MNTWYKNEFARAIEKTLSWDLEAPGIEMCEFVVDVPAALEAFRFFAIEQSWEFPYDMAGNCINRHLAIGEWLQVTDIAPSVLTVGEVFVNGKPRYGASYDKLRWELDNPADGKRTFEAHVWLTFPNYGILDVVMPASLLGKRYESGPPTITNPDEMVLFAGPETNKQRKSYVTIPAHAKDGAFLYRDLYGKKKKLTYKPMLVGQDYLIKSDEALREHVENFQR